MSEKAKRPPQHDELFSKIRECIEKGLYRQSRHAIDRQIEREIDLPDVLYVLKSGYHEKQKTSFDEIFHTWKYAIRGKTLDSVDIRIIMSFDEDGMLIITVMRVLKI